MYWDPTLARICIEFLEGCPSHELLALYQEHPRLAELFGNVPDSITTLDEALGYYRSQCNTSLAPLRCDILQWSQKRLTVLNEYEQQIRALQKRQKVSTLLDQ